MADGAPGRGSVERRGWIVRGRVQGVGFRWWTARTAERLGLGGQVRNLRDGAVEVHACGPAEAVARLEAGLHSGPMGARVDRVEAIEPDPGMPEGEFRIGF